MSEETNLVKKNYQKQKGNIREKKKKWKTKDRFPKRPATQDSRLKQKSKSVNLRTYRFTIGVSTEFGARHVTTSIDIENK